MTGGAKRLTTREAASRLGVKPETVYAYVSRGLLDSRREPGGRGSTFDAGQVEELAGRGRGQGRADALADAAVAPVRTEITSIGPDGYRFRGVDPLALAERYGYEEVALWLWTGTLRPGARFVAPGQVSEAAVRAVGALPAHSGLMDRLRAAAVAAGAADPLRFDLSEDNVIATARTLVATLACAPAVTPGSSARGTAAAGGAPMGSPSLDAPLAARLWGGLTPAPPGDASLRCLDAALVLLADHDLAVSTLAARVAASARAHPYAVVSAGLGALDGPLHGAASAPAHRMLVEVLERGSASAVVADHLRSGRAVPGLGHRLYTGQDPRAGMLFGLLEDVPVARPALDAARAVVETTGRHVPLHANVDLALAVLSVSCGMPPDAGEAVFSVARTAGWVAHALEEYRERPLRLRPTGIYHGPPAPMPLPEPEPAPGPR